MRYKVFLLFALAAFASCRPHYFRNSSASMEATIKQGEKFYVAPARTFKQNDLAVFDYFGNDYSSPPDDMGKYKLKWEKRVFRLIALSGDVVEIRQGEVYVNNEHFPAPRSAKIEYEVDSKVPIGEFEKMRPENYYSETSGDTLKYYVPLTLDEASHYRIYSDVLKIQKDLREVFVNDTLYAKDSSEQRWSSDNYGPLRIPSPGDSIRVNEANLKLYHNIPKIHLGLNIVKEKLYFLLGDNRHFAEDSRFIGLISHSKMFGVVLK